MGHDIETVNILNYLDTKVAVIMDAATEMVATYGEQAWEVVAMVIRTKVASVMLPGLIVSTLLFILVLVMYRKAKKNSKWNKEHSWSERKPAEVMAAIGVLAGVLGGVIALFTWLNLWNIAILFEPKLFIVREALNKVL